MAESLPVCLSIPPSLPPSGTDPLCSPNYVLLVGFKFPETHLSLSSHAKLKGMHHHILSESVSVLKILCYYYPTSH